MAKKFGSSEFFANHPNSLRMFQTKAQKAIIGHITYVSFLSDIILRFSRMLYIYKYVYFLQKKHTHFFMHYECEIVEYLTDTVLSG